ncbi:LuxR C-terminal-related transcriptional regulator [Cognatishimia sp. SS12]|uniref:LuxR C-terminal-related transcriptional regulator n=1 Tax=Cognatishimia sp. SS12 TaxID=2979465 RepID=UPI00232C96CF|nr:LuxR C-terminal-related transcriptional regulator [Cognatishimia sp. SS12]MDC0738550.1 LuxR C-terminal-related transcriptional regulator [Cognatishimia sp. SS12]
MAKPIFSPEELSELIGVVYDSAFEDVQWKGLLTTIRKMFPGVGALAWGYDGDTMLPEYVNAGQTPIFPSPFEFNMKNEIGETIAEAVKRTPNGFVVRTKNYFPEAQLLNARCYTDFLQPMGFRNSLHLKVDHNGDRGAFLGFPLPADPDLEAELHDPLFEVLKLLSPHAVRASQLARALALAKRATEAFTGFFDGIILPMLVTDVQGKFLFANKAGRQILGRSDPFQVAQNGALKLTNGYDTADLYHKISQTSRDLVQSGLRVDTSDTPLMLAISPFRPSMRDASAIDRHLLDDEQMFAIFVGQSVQDAVNTALLEDVFDLSAREAQICKGLLTGQNVAAIAEASGRSPKTVRNQIQMIYEKVGVSSNAELLDRLTVFRTVGTMFENNPEAQMPDAMTALSQPH